MTDMEKQLNQYYERVRIAPVSWSRDLDEMFSEFQCEKKTDCRKACFGDWKQEKEFLFQPHTKKESITVSQEYQDEKYHGDQIPRIVVLSLSKPQPGGAPDNNPAANSETYLDPDKHWSRTLVTVRSLLHPFIASENFPKPVEYGEIEKLFVHVRTAKCCSNANNGGAEPPKVYANCGGYLGEELSILKPDVIVTQGNEAHKGAKRHFNAIDIEQVKGLDLGLDLERPIAHIVNLKEGNQCVYWLKMTFPTIKFGWMKRWNKEAGPAIESESNVVGKKRAKRKHLMRYGKAIKEFINDR